MTTRCKQCRERVSEARSTSEEMALLCQVCKGLKKLDSPEMPVLPVYSLEKLGALVDDKKPVLTRSGLMLLGQT